jgi:hypothetical protein
MDGKFCDDEMEDKRADYEMMGNAINLAKPEFAGSEKMRGKTGDKKRRRGIKWRADKLFPWILGREAFYGPFCALSFVPSSSYPVVHQS